MLALTATNSRARRSRISGSSKDRRPLWPLFHVQPCGFPTMIHKNTGRFCSCAIARASIKFVRHATERHASSVSVGSTRSNRFSSGSVTAAADFTFTCRVRPHSAPGTARTAKRTTAAREEKTGFITVRRIRQDVNLSSGGLGRWP